MKLSPILACLLVLTIGLHAAELNVATDGKNTNPGTQAAPLNTIPASAKVISYSKNAEGVTFQLEYGVMKIRVCKDDIIEVLYTSLSSLESKSSLVISNRWKNAPSFTVSEHAGTVTITTARLSVNVDESTAAVSFSDLQGHVILEEAGANAKRVTAATVSGIPTHTCSSEFLSPTDEALYGLGCHPKDGHSINYKGRNQDMAIRYMTGAIPVLLSTRGYGLMWDNYSASNFYGAERTRTAFKYVSESGTMVDYYFLYGPEFDRIIALYREATGAAPMFPKWSFGLFQSQDRYNSQSEVLAVKDGYRNNHIPVDCIVQDWFYWAPEPIGSHILNPQRYPDPKRMVDELHDAKIHAMISIWPVFGKGTKNFDEMAAAGNMTDLFCVNIMTHTKDLYYDAHSEKARDMYWRQAKEGLIAAQGWDAWWADSCEPDNGTRLDLRKQAVFAPGRGIDYFNTYSLEHTGGFYTNWRKDIPGKRAFFLARQAFAGQQRNAAALWSSDINCTWEDYRNQVPQAINACVSGIPYWTSDIGGYHLKWNSPDWSAPANRELFTRWFQFGAFSPIFRIHGKGERALFSKNWDEPTKAILLKYDNLRYRLIPYLYSLGWKVTDEGYTILRSLAFDYRNDTRTRNIPDQYLFGPAFMVCPVTEPMAGPGNNALPKKTRQVYLPAGNDWYDFWTGELLRGGQTIAAAAPIETLPLYVKPGSIVPMGPFVQYAEEKSSEPLEIRIYPGADGHFTLYEDENDNYNYEKGMHATIDFRWDDKARKLVVGKRSGSFPGMVADRMFRVVLVGKGKGAGVDISSQANATVHYDGGEQTLQL